MRLILEERVGAFRSRLYWRRGRADSVRGVTLRIREWIWLGGRTEVSGEDLVFCVGESGSERCQDEGDDAESGPCR